MVVPAEAAGTVTIGSRQVPRVGYGLGSLTRAASADAQAYGAGVDLLRHAFELGVTFFDTAQFYGAGLANRLLADAFADRRGEVLYASKVGARPLTSGPVPMTAAQKPRELRESVEDNLRTLRTDHLDLVYLRRMDMLPGLIVEGDQQVSLDDQLAELIALRDAGTISAIGLSHVTVDQFTSALPARVAAVSNIHNLLRRDDEVLLDVAEAHGIVWSPYFPLGGGGYAALPKVTEEPAVVAAAERLGATTTQVGLAWLLARSPLSLVISGTSSPGHLEENVGSAAVRLPRDLRHQLDGVGND
ncbi:aldo/keto reductase [Allobranchiibius huperziae]|uniref:Aryl-alcohol dehydrogenase-like predicted oxidoreductase n=1 Tax=Allobranchiibius huperziae TaxID=1874116 RepID=A0A853DNK5_9MICO|nr:aldo/keto reductase [Allobranchiibius huperziae]NYJ76341.1 aryl-alcohol dehydrogenase-like predicted oxidoreductase [Allobranchiibius huperziae]